MTQPNEMVSSDPIPVPVILTATVGKATLSMPYDTFHRTAAKMKRIGGGFFSAIGDAALRADLGNARRLYQAFADDFGRYASYPD